MTALYEVRFTRSAKRALTDTLPESVAAFAFIMSALRDNPKGLGKLLDEPLIPLYSARRGEYRLLYRLEDSRLTIEVVSGVHRRDAYRT